MKKIFYIVFILLSLTTQAQQEPHYTQYMYNMSVVNPAYVIDEPSLIELGSLYRSQWVGLSGAPKTANIFAHIPINNRVEFSVNYMNDRIGSSINITQNIFNVDAAYKMRINETLKLSFGLKGELDNLGFNFANSTSSDPSLEKINTTVFNMGAGIFIFDKKYYAGLSSPNLIPNTISIGEMYDYKSTPHFFFIAGYVFDLNYSFKLKPSVVVKEVAGAPLSYDFSLNTLYRNRFELGVSYRNQDAYSGLVGINATPSLRLGYSYDYNTSDLGDFNTGSHEFILLYSFDVLGIKKNYSSPRFY